MRYNEAVFIGQQRSKEAQMKLFDYTGFAMLTYTVKQDPKDNVFMPVGKELFVSKKVVEGYVILYLTDKDGFAKAQSKPLDIKEGEKIYEKIKRDGISELEGTLKTI